MIYMDDTRSSSCGRRRSSSCVRRSSSCGRRSSSCTWWRYSSCTIYETWNKNRNHESKEWKQENKKRKMETGK